MAAGTATLDVTNIGPRERRKRLVAGIAVLFATAGAVVALAAAGLPPWVRLATLFPFAFGVLALAQAREGL